MAEIEKKKSMRKRHHCEDCGAELNQEDLDAGRHLGCLRHPTTHLAQMAKEADQARQADAEALASSGTTTPPVPTPQDPPPFVLDLQQTKARLDMLSKWDNWDYKWDIGIQWPGSNQPGSLVLFEVPPPRPEGVLGDIPMAKVIALFPTQYRPLAEAIAFWRQEVPAMMGVIEVLARCLSGDIDFYTEVLAVPEGHQVVIPRKLVMLRVRELMQVISAMKGRAAMATQFSPDGFTEVVKYVASLEAQMEAMQGQIDGMNMGTDAATQVNDWHRKVFEASTAQKDQILMALATHVPAHVFDSITRQAEKDHPMPDPPGEELPEGWLGAASADYVGRPISPREAHMAALKAWDDAGAYGSPPVCPTCGGSTVVNYADPCPTCTPFQQPQSEATGAPEGQGPATMMVGPEALNRVVDGLMADEGALAEMLADPAHSEAIQAAQEQVMEMLVEPGWEAGFTIETSEGLAQLPSYYMAPGLEYNVGDSIKVVAPMGTVARGMVYLYINGAMKAIGVYNRGDLVLMALPETAGIVQGLDLEGVPIQSHDQVQMLADMEARTFKVLKNGQVVATGTLGQSHAEKIRQMTHILNGTGGIPAGDFGDTTAQPALPDVAIPYVEFGDEMPQEGGTLDGKE